MAGKSCLVCLPRRLAQSLTTFPGCRTRFSRAYVDTSIAVRICTSLGLNHNVFLPNHLPLSSFLAHRTALPPPSDEEEARERSVTWWFAYTVETFSAAATVRSIGLGALTEAQSSR